MRSKLAGCLIVAFGLCAGPAVAQESSPAPAAAQGNSPAAAPTVAQEGGPAAAPTDAGHDSTVNGLYGSAEYILWWFKGANLPPLVTVGSFNDFPIGALGQPGTSVAFGGKELDDNARSGIRFTIGYECGDDKEFGIEANYFILATHAQQFSTSSLGVPGSVNLARPFFNEDAGREDAELISLASPNAAIQAGSVFVNLDHQLLGAELNGRAALPAGQCYHIGLLVGFRYLEFQENLDIEQSSQALPTSLGISSQQFDSFHTRNQFYGGQVGVTADWHRNGLFASVRAKVAVGDMEQVVTISGTTINTDPINGQVFVPSGLLAQPSNSGQHTHDTFAVVPEVGINVGYQLTRYLSGYVGYTLLYADNMLRPGDQIDRAVSFRGIAGGPGSAGAAPTFTPHESDFWAQGISIGLQVNY